MPKYTCQLIIVFCIFMLTACGPKDIATGSSDTYYNDSAREPSTSVADHARYPSGGNLTQQRLYLLNQPGVQMDLQAKQRNFFNRQAGINPLEEEKKMQTPKQRSPFRDF